MITVGMDYHVIPGRQQDFEDKFRAVLGALNDAEGHERSRMFRDIDEDTSYLIISEWATQEQFTAFIRSEAFRAVTDWGKESILAGRPQHRVYKQ